MTAPIDRLELETHRLVTEFPPRWGHPNKEVVYAIAYPAGSRQGGRIGYSRWAAMTLPPRVDIAAALRRIEPRPSAYDYAAEGPGRGGVEWHVNFADPALFVAGTTALLAQDELQVAEHPALASLRRAIVAHGLKPVTVEDRNPTPVLITGVERRCRIALDRNPAEGRPQGLYGNAFARADASVVRRATMRVDPPTVTNLIAMAAPSGGFGAYAPDEIERVLVTAFTGFRAAVLESPALGGNETAVVVHTGFWGCGAFGGNRILMTMLQLLAAQMAGVDRLVLHMLDPAGPTAHTNTETLLTREFGDTETETTTLSQRIAGFGLKWGISDGN